MFETLGSDPFCANRKEVDSMKITLKDGSVKEVNKGISVLDLAKEILYIAEKSLIEMDTNEEKYLDSIKEYTLNGITPADVIIRNWNGIWNKDIRKLIKFVGE